MHCLLCFYFRLILSCHAPTPPQTRKNGKIQIDPSLSYTNDQLLASLVSSVPPFQWTPPPLDYFEAHPGHHIISFVNISVCLIWFRSFTDREYFLMFGIPYFLVQLFISNQFITFFFHCCIYNLIWLNMFSLRSITEMNRAHLAVEKGVLPLTLLLMLQIPPCLVPTISVKIV